MRGSSLHVAVASGAAAALAHRQLFEQSNEHVALTEETSRAGFNKEISTDVYFLTVCMIVLFDLFIILYYYF